MKPSQSTCRNLDEIFPVKSQQSMKIYLKIYIHLIAVIGIFHVNDCSHWYINTSRSIFLRSMTFQIRDNKNLAYQVDFKQSFNSKIKGYTRAGRSCYPFADVALEMAA